MYNPTEQYRCAIIRGKAQKDLDNLLPFYANIINNVCPCTKKDFDKSFNTELSVILFKSQFNELNFAHQKTIRNHRTEIAGKLFGLFFTSNGSVYMSESCRFLLNTGDQPAFFKNLCLNFQFPNATQKPHGIQAIIANKIRLKPFHFVISLLDKAQSQNINICKQDLAFYVLNSLHVLQGIASVDEVLHTIVNDRLQHIERRKLSGSKEMQHVTEQLNLLELSNIIIQEAGLIVLNLRERKIIDTFIQQLETPFFDVRKYFENDTPSADLAQGWGMYFGALHNNPALLLTNESALERDQITEPQTQLIHKPTTIEVGDKGELFVFEMEKERVLAYKKRMVNKVLLLGKVKGLGYDISSIEAEGEEPDFAKYIEVKSTTRITEPTFSDMWRDTINLTAKEWIAAKQYRRHYNIHRVFFTPKRTVVYVVNDPYTKYEKKKIEVYPTIFQMEITNNHITLL